MLELVTLANKFIEVIRTTFPTLFATKSEYSRDVTVTIRNTANSNKSLLPISQTLLVFRDFEYIRIFQYDKNQNASTNKVHLANPNFISIVIEQIKYHHIDNQF